MSEFTVSFKIEADSIEELESLLLAAFTDNMDRAVIRVTRNDIFEYEYVK